MSDSGTHSCPHHNLGMTGISFCPHVGIALVITVCLYFLLRRNPRLKRYCDQLPGPQGYPIVGNLLSCLGPPEQYVVQGDQMLKEFGPLYKVWIGNFLPYIVLCDADYAEKVLNSSESIDKGKYDYSLLHDWLGYGLLTAPRNIWFPRRKLLTPAFHFKILEDFMPILNEQASIFVDCLQAEAKEEIGSARPFDIAPYISKCALDVICETAMGKRMNAQTSSINKEYIDAVNGMCALLTTKMFRPWYRIPFIYRLTQSYYTEQKYLRILKDFCENVIEGRMQEREGNSLCLNDEIDGLCSRKRKAFLDLLMDCAQNGEGISPQGIREEVNTFMFAGHDTTAANLGWTMMLLAAHPESQKLVQEELDQIFGDCPERDVTSADLAKMKYLEGCIKESLRLYPSVPCIMRQIETDLKMHDGKIIPRGATAMVSIYYTQRDPKYYPEPESFKPERFTVENSSGRHPYAFIPFSAGSRNCIGQKFALMEEKVVLAKMLRKYSILEGDKKENVVPIPDIVLRQKGGLKVKLVKRKL